MEVGVLLGVVVLMMVMVTVAEGVGIVVVGSVQREQVLLVLQNNYHQ